jgi:hypothetical protein
VGDPRLGIAAEDEGFLATGLAESVTEIGRTKPVEDGLGGYAGRRRGGGSRGAGGYGGQHLLLKFGQVV